MNALGELFRRHLADWNTGWSMGSFGAIAEFHQDGDEATVVDEPAGLTRATKRGGIRIDPSRLGEIRAIAYETPSPKRHRWSQAIALCLPKADAKANGRSVLTELGPDRDAVRETDREAILFDMGLMLPQCDFCIRTADETLIKVLRQNAGRSLFDPANSAMASILPAHPHRIALTGIGRVEVYQKIGGPDTGGVSPPGPHTHILPKLLKTGRTHSANTPIPNGLIPLGSLHPGNPVIGPLGEDRAFDDALHESFQRLFVEFGIPEAVVVKSRLAFALKTGATPEDFDGAPSRLERASLRVALRQLAHIAELRGDTKSAAAVAHWQTLHDQSADAGEDDDDAPGH